MLKTALLVLSLFAVGSAGGQDVSPSRNMGRALAERWSGRFKQIANRMAEISRESQRLPSMPDLDALGTHGFHSNFTQDSESDWFEISWDTPCEMDAVALVPSRITTQSGMRSNYGFPKRFRIEARATEGGAPSILTEVSDTFLDLRRGEPWFFSFPRIKVRSLRFIPLALNPLPGKQVRFFALSELLVFNGENNLAESGIFTAPFSIDTEVGWNIRYLGDSQTPLGPPEIPEPGRSLGWHAEAQFPHPKTWAVIDLGKVEDFDSIRLIAARGDAPIKGPGFGFPESFSFSVSDTGTEGSWQPLWNSGKTVFPNPGYNPVDFHFSATQGRFVRLDISKYHSPDGYALPRILISEMEVRQGTVNLAAGCPVSTPDHQESIPHDATRVWSRAGLTDGFSSTGRLISTRAWVAGLSRGFDLYREQTSLLAEREHIINRYQTAMLVSVFGLLGSGVLGMVIWQMKTRRSNRRQVAALRQRISSDLHDEVGSNLATIALLAELPPGIANLEDIHRLSQESSQSLREIVEITLAPKKARKPIAERLREIATLMLCHHHWSLDTKGAPKVDLEQRRNLVFFFKEALHNIMRHAGATHVSLAFEDHPGRIRLIIEDDGRGIAEASSDVKTNLRTLHQRAESLQGTLTVESIKDRGTRLTLDFPTFKKQPQP